MDWMTFVTEMSKSLGLGTLIGALATHFVHGYFERRRRQLTRLDERRCEALVEIYTEIHEMRAALEKLATPDSDAAEFARRDSAAAIAGNTFRNKSQRSRIWFDKRINSLLDDLWDQAKHTLYKLQDSRTPGRKSETFQLALTWVRERIPEAMAAVEAEIRSIIRSQE